MKRLLVWLFRRKPKEQQESGVYIIFPRVPRENDMFSGFF